MVHFNMAAFRKSVKKNQADIADILGCKQPNVSSMENTGKITEEQLRILHNNFDKKIVDEFVVTKKFNLTAKGGMVKSDKIIGSAVGKNAKTINKEYGSHNLFSIYEDSEGLFDLMESIKIFQKTISKLIEQRDYTLKQYDKMLEMLKEKDNTINNLLEKIKT